MVSRLTRAFASCDTEWRESAHAPEQAEQELEQLERLHQAAVAHEDERLDEHEAELRLELGDALLQERRNLRRELRALLRVARRDVAHELYELGEALLRRFRRLDAHDGELGLVALVLQLELGAPSRGVALYLALQRRERRLGARRGT